jgi:hypothetical protein
VLAIKAKKGSLTAVIMTILLWRWPVKLCLLQTAATAFAPSILRKLPHQQQHHHGQESSSSVFAVRVSLPNRRFPTVSPATVNLPLQQSQRDLRTFLGTRTEAVDEEYVEAEDLDGLQDLFNRYCDREGLMTKSATKRIPAIAELLVGADLNEGSCRRSIIR